jgi:hypothetical protein
VADMNDNSEHDLALKAQTAIVAVDAVQRACSDSGSVDAEMVGDWPVISPASGPVDAIDTSGGRVDKTGFSSDRCVHTIASNSGGADGA